MTKKSKIHKAVYVGGMLDRQYVEYNDINQLDDRLIGFKCGKFSYTSHDDGRPIFETELYHLIVRDSVAIYVTDSLMHDNKWQSVLMASYKPKRKSQRGYKI